MWHRGICPVKTWRSPAVYWFWTKVENVVVVVVVLWIAVECSSLLESSPKVRTPTCKNARHSKDACQMKIINHQPSHFFLGFLCNCSSGFTTAKFVINNAVLNISRASIEISSHGCYTRIRIHVCTSAMQFNIHQRKKLKTRADLLDLIKCTRVTRCHLNSLLFPASFLSFYSQCILKLMYGQWTGIRLLDGHKYWLYSPRIEDQTRRRPNRSPMRTLVTSPNHEFLFNFGFNYSCFLLNLGSILLNHKPGCQTPLLTLFIKFPDSKKIWAQTENINTLAKCFSVNILKLLYWDRMTFLFDWPISSSLS